LTPSNGSKNQIGWQFKDEQGRDWNGSAAVDASSESGKFVLTVKLARRPI